MVKNRLFLPFFAQKLGKLGYFSYLYSVTLKQNIMKTLAELKQAIADKKQLVWNDPDPIEGNDYTINFIEDIDNEFEDDIVDYPILIQYNDFGSEAQVYLHEILVK
jgi:hypothetical protein